MVKIAIRELQMTDSADLTGGLSVLQLTNLKGGWGEYESEGYKKKEKEDDDEKKKKYHPSYSYHSYCY